MAKIGLVRVGRMRAHGDIEERDTGVWSWLPWYLEPAWLVVVAAALTQQGRAEVGISGSQIGALSLERIAKLGIEELEAFSHIAPPKTLPILQLREARLFSVWPKDLSPTRV